MHFGERLNDQSHFIQKYRFESINGLFSRARKGTWNINYMVSFFFYSVVNTYTKNERNLQRGSRNVAGRNLKILTFIHDKIGIWACVTAVSSHILFFIIRRETEYGVCASYRQYLTNPVLRTMGLMLSCVSMRR